MSIFLTLGQAARQYGTGKGTLSKAISSGKLSATRNEDGSWKIDPAEMARYWETNGHRFRSETRAETGADDRLETDAKTDVMVAALNETIAVLKQANANLEDKYRSLERDRDVWRETAQTAQKLLAPPAQKPPPKPPARRPWWRRMAG